MSQNRQQNQSMERLVKDWPILISQQSPSSTKQKCKSKKQKQQRIQRVNDSNLNSNPNSNLIKFGDSSKYM
jgi:hypothetical protein